MAIPLPQAFRKALASASASDDAPNPMGVSESESDEVPKSKGDKPNPLKAWATNKLSAV